VRPQLVDKDHAVERTPRCTAGHTAQMSTLFTDNHRK